MSGHGVAVRVLRKREDLAFRHEGPLTYVPEHAWGVVLLVPDGLDPDPVLLQVRDRRVACLRTPVLLHLSSRVDGGAVGAGSGSEIKVRGMGVEVPPLGWVYE